MQGGAVGVVQSNQGTVFSSVWTVIVLTALIFIVALIQGHLSPSVLLALVVLLFLGALWPPLGVLVGGLALFWIVLTHGKQIGQRVGVVPAPDAGGQ